MLGLMTPINMQNKIVTLVLIVAIVVLAGLILLDKETEQAVVVDGEQIVATVYKSPTCGCCGVYASYLKKEGYEVDVENTQDMSAIKQRFGVPYELESCHTMEIDGYVVEGHIPEAVVHKLLTERPDIKGIGMQGMPSGSPGMPGPKNDDFIIYEINHDGTQGDIFETI